MNEYRYYCGIIHAGDNHLEIAPLSDYEERIFNRIRNGDISDPMASECYAFYRKEVNYDRIRTLCTARA